MKNEEAIYIYESPTGVIRNMYPIEIGRFVKLLRKEKTWKQCVLASEAKTTERTIQRIENGEKVSAPILEHVAEALSLEKEEFTKSRYIPSPEEMLESIQNLAFEDDNYQFINIELLNNERCFIEVLTSHCYFFDDQYILDEAKESLEHFKDNLIDWSDIYNAISHAEKLKARKSLLGEICEIESKGYIAEFGTYFGMNKMLKGKMKVAVIIFHSKSDVNAEKITRALCPKEITNLHF